MVNVGAGLRGKKRAVRWFIFLSNKSRTKKIPAYVSQHPRYSHVTPDQVLVLYDQSLKFYTQSRKHLCLFWTAPSKSCQKTHYSKLLQ